MTPRAAIRLGFIWLAPPGFHRFEKRTCLLIPPDLLSMAILTVLPNTGYSTAITVEFIPLYGNRMSLQVLCYQKPLFKPVHVVARSEGPHICYPSKFRAAHLMGYRQSSDIYKTRTLYTVLSARRRKKNVYLKSKTKKKRGSVNVEDWTLMVV